MREYRRYVICIYQVQEDSPREGLRLFLPLFLQEGLDVIKDDQPQKGGENSPLGKTPRDMSSCAEVDSARALQSQDKASLC